jgi:hypothetical protein
VLFGYPIEATEENWLHECLCQILQVIHTHVEASQTPPSWPDIIPETYRNRLKKRTGLKDRVNKYREALEKLTRQEKQQVRQALSDQNKIDLLVSCQNDCETLSDLPSDIREPIRSLFDFSFNLLSDLEIRDKHYRAIYHNIPSHTCPFCGCEYFDAPTAPREALDHYLPKSQYAFAAVNLHNLVPMGNKCNPYGYNAVKISLDASQPFAGKDGQLPKWNIAFTPNTEETETWDNVFKLCERYKRDILDEQFKSWLEHFRAWCNRARIDVSDDQKLIDAIKQHTLYYEDLGINDRAFLKAAMFRMLYLHCQQGDKRLIKLIKDVVSGTKV